MKKYIIAFFLFCLSLFAIDSVYAAELSLTGYNSLINASLWNCSGSNTCSTSVSTSTNVYGDYLIYTSGSEVSIGSNGIFWAIQSPVNFNHNYLYSVSALVCYNSKVNNTFQFLTGTSGDLNAFEYPLYSQVYNNWSPNDYIYLSDGGYGYLTLNTCRNVSGFINPDKSGNFLGLRLKNSGGTIAAQYVWLLGLKVESLGVDSDALRSILRESISSSGLATAQSVAEVQKAQKEIKKEIAGMQEKQQQTNEKLDTLNDNITNSDSSGATNDASGFFDGFTTDTYGLTSIITSPLNLIKSLTSKTCSPLNLQVPFVNKTMQLPCMSTIYNEHFGSFVTIYQTITFGIVSYWVCVRIFALVKDFKNPDHDEIEVVDL